MARRRCYSSLQSGTSSTSVVILSRLARNPRRSFTFSFPVMSGYSEARYQGAPNLAPIPFGQVPFFNVTSAPFNAKVDGVTDDSAALAGAIAAAGVKGGIVWIPGGTMIANPPASIPSNVTIRGSGMNATIVQATDINSGFKSVDMSYIVIQDLTFIGASNNGASNTVPGISIKASTVDVLGIIVERVRVRQTKSTQGAINIVGNGDDLTLATHFCINPRVRDCVADTYYDQDPTNLGVGSYGIFTGYGCTDQVVENNYVDGSNGKHGIGNIGDVSRVVIAKNTVLNCGLNAPSVFYGYGIFVYANTVGPSPSVVVTENKIRQTNRAGIYIQGITGAVVANNVLNLCDQHSPGLGGTATGALSINENSNDTRQGAVSITGNTITDPGSIAINLNLLSALTTLSPSTVVGNSLKNTTPATALFGIVIAGSGWVVANNALLGFTSSIFLNNGSDDVVGNGVIDANIVDMTGTAGSSGITTTNSTKTIGTLVITNNCFIASTVNALNVRLVSNITCSNNVFRANTGAIITVIAHQGSVCGNVTDGGSVGLTVQCVAADANARISVTGNVMGRATTVYGFTPNTGKILVGHGNDFGAIDGITTNNNNSPSVVLTTTNVQWWNTTLTANRTATLSGTRAYNGAKIRVLRNAAVPGAFTLAVVDGVSTATLFTFAVSTNGWADFEFDGTNWQFIGSGPVT